MYIYFLTDLMLCIYNFDRYVYITFNAHAMINLYVYKLRGSEDEEPLQGAFHLNKLRVLD